MLITSISGIRGTIGGTIGENLTPMDIAGFVSAYGTWSMSQFDTPTVVVGRDGRVSGSMVLDMTIQTLVGLGVNVINLDYATTPTVEMEILRQGAHGGIVITASHNPKEYNGLKMLNQEGEFLSAESGQEILDIKNTGEYVYASTDNLGQVTRSYNHTRDHIKDILALDLVNVEAIKSAKFKVCVDAINSVGGIAVPLLLEKLGVETVGLFCDINGDFQHAPEPLEKNLGDLKSLVRKTESHLGISVDPDVDRLVLVDQNGEMFGEEYTIVAVADYILSKTPGPTVSNLSSSRALNDMAREYDQEYYASAVGEKNVVEKMKEVSAVIGGEGSGGVIYPALHYGRDALVGIALFLSLLAERKISPSDLRDTYPHYAMSKEKVDLPSREKISSILQILDDQKGGAQSSRIDGLKIDLEDSWVHIRASNTEPILRIYTEATTQEKADLLASEYIDHIRRLI